MTVSTDAEWFKTAVFYEVLVRSFADSNNDGIGDLKGLSSKLDYLQWLGIDCLWLPPFFPSPLRDGGYDVADYTGVLPELGTVDDMRDLLTATRERGMKVIIDFVMNHTSDAHPWFQASRSDPSGPYGDFYVWRDQPEEYLDARVIFIDSISSNWSFDEVRGQYFWHRFYAHQPDLNFENPRVLEEILDAVRFWLELGVDGFRLDAVPYLIEQDGTNCENLPGTHEILKKVRKVVDEEFPGKIMLCEANQWPNEVIEYFGDDDECHMAFHFPVMPRLYLGIREGSRASISQILADTPAIPPGCQWGTFLRNHDELTLEMVTEDERQYMWSEYAPDPRMKCNLGIRRRLAPLVDGDRRRIELLHGLLLALPGSPVLYYGDEIGMGDNIWLQDRDGVRTPMQWTEGPGAGFSSAEVDTFPYPLIDSPGYGPEVLNVAAQQADPASLLHWLRDTLAIRRDRPVFGRGDFTDLGGADAVFSFVRSLEGTVVVCVNNLSATAQSVELDVSAWSTSAADVIYGSPAELTLDAELLRLSLAPYAFCWINLGGSGDA
ncbi:MAG: maltose alpha-D-glucosyltransferase [Micropruina sp.]